MCPFVILELYLQPIFQGTLDARSCSRIRQKIDGIAEKEIVTGHGGAIGNVFHLQAVGQDAGTVYLHPVVKNEDTDRCIPVQRAVNKGIDHKLNQAAIRNFEPAQRIKFFLHLYVFKIPGKESHDGFKLMQQVSLHIRIVHFVTELLAAYMVPDKTDALSRHDRQPTLGVFTEQQHGGYGQTSVRTNKSQITHQFVQVMSLGNGIGYVVKRSLMESVADQTFLFQYNGKAVLQEYFESVFIQVVQRSIFHHRFVRSETATFGHHLRQFSIIKHLALVCTVLYPDYAFIVVVRLVVSLFDGCHHHAAAFHLSRVNIEQDAWNDIFRSDIAEHVGRFLHLSIRQGVKFPCLVIDANYKLTSAIITHSN